MHCSVIVFAIHIAFPCRHSFWSQVFPHQVHHGADSLQLVCAFPPCWESSHENPAGKLFQAVVTALTAIPPGPAHPLATSKRESTLSSREHTPGFQSILFEEVLSAYAVAHLNTVPFVCKIYKSQLSFNSCPQVLSSQQSLL